MEEEQKLEGVLSELCVVVEKFLQICKTRTEKVAYGDSECLSTG